MLAHTHEAIVAANSTDELLAAVCRVAVAHGGVRMAWAAVVGEDGRLRPLVSSGTGLAQQALITLHGAPGGTAEAAARTGMPVIENALDSDGAPEPWHVWARADRYHAVGAFPIVVNDRVVATVAAYAEEPGFFDHDGRDLFFRLAASVGFTWQAFARDGLRRRTQDALIRGAAEAHRRARQQAAVADLGRRALTGADLDELMADAAAEVARALDVQVVSVMELVGDALVWRAGEWPGSQAGNLRIRVRPCTQAAFALESSPVVVVDDLEVEQRFNPSTLLRAMGMRSCMSVRIHVGGQPYGLINAASSRANMFGVDDSTFVEAVAHVLSAAIERHRVDFAIRAKALHDPLTGLPNRSLLLDRLSQALNRLRRSDHHLAILFADLDRFKLINDRFGHAGGDRLLAALALRLRGALRPEDTVARLGGDEFVVICEGLSRPSEAEVAGERMAAALKEPFVIDGQEVFVTMSTGVAVVNREEADLPGEALLRDADIAMYEAKERGRARVEMYSSALRESATDRRATESALRAALGRDEFRLLYQPVVTVFDGAPIGVEALVRWDRPQFGVIQPGQFIPVAEDIGVFVPIGSWVLEQACRQAARVASEREGFFMSVNISPRQLREPSLVGEVTAALSASTLGPERPLSRTVRGGSDGGHEGGR